MIEIQNAPLSTVDKPNSSKSGLTVPSATLVHDMVLDAALLAEAELTPHRLRSPSASDLPESTPTSLKKRRKISHNPSPSRKTVNSPISPSHEYTAADIGRVVWADIGVTHTQTYWWPGVVQKALLDDGKPEVVERFGLSIRLFPEKGKNSSALAGSKIRPLSSFNAVKPFIVDTNFQARHFNPILVDKSSASQYPSERSLLDNYALAYERHSTSRFDDDDNLPDVEACMIPLSQQSLRSTAGLNRSPSQSREHTSPTFSPLTSPTCSPQEKEGQQQGEESNDDEDLGPDPEIDISNESVLAKERAKGEYWPARVVGYVGVRSVGQRRRKTPKAAKQKVKKEKYYQIRFCDGNLAEIPRSFFLTSDQPEFHVVPIGQVKTSLITFEDLVEELEVHLDELDLIVKGQSTDPSIQLQHSNFLSNAKTRGLVPHEVRYGKYHEELILQVGQYLETRYLRASSDPRNQQNDALEGFENLPASHKTQYVLDILVPHLLWLVTVEQYKPDAIEALGAEAKAEDILEKAKVLARDELHEADIVDQVYTLRNQDSVGYCNSKAGMKQSIKRNTSNSQKTGLGIGDGDDESDLL